MTASYRYKGSGSVLHAWEDGLWTEVPPPPAVHSAQYRQAIVKVFLRLAGNAPGLSVLSLGCGNAMVEVELKAAGFDVMATDYSREAVELAAQKGLLACVLDVMAHPSVFTQYDIIYVDGLLGHLAVIPEGLSRLTNLLKAFAAPWGQVVLVYELADGDTPCFVVTGLPGAKFYRPPAGTVAGLMATLLPGWEVRSTDDHEYVRPGRGLRRREILVLTRSTADH